MSGQPRTQLTLQTRAKHLRQARWHVVWREMQLTRVGVHE
jgi:hypothetical protein